MEDLQTDPVSYDTAEISRILCKRFPDQGLGPNMPPNTVAGIVTWGTVY